MIPIRNIQKRLVVLLFAAGVGLLVMGAYSSHDVSLSFSGANDQLSRQFLQHASVNDAHLPKVFNENAACRAHKNLYKHFRGRFSPDFLSASFHIDSDHFRMILFPYADSGTSLPAVLTSPCLRGPPCA